MTTRRPDPTTITRACATGDHGHCGRHLMLAAVDAAGNIYGVCACPVCKHVLDYRKAR